MSLQFSFHAVYEANILSALEFAHLNGFQGIQVAVETPHFEFSSINNTEIEEINEYCRKYHLYISLHGPDDVTSLFTTNPKLQEGIFKYYQDFFEFAEKISAKLVTIHLGRITTFPICDGKNLQYPEEDVPLYRKNLNLNLQKLVSLKNQKKFHLCVENYGFNDIIMEELEPFLYSNEINLCWDFPKTFNRQGVLDTKIFDFIQKHLISVKQVHLHDMNSRGKGHQVLGSGILDFSKFFSILKNEMVIDYCFEVRPASKALESLNYFQRLGLHKV